MKSVITSITPFSNPCKTLDPFLFIVYHRDVYPPGNARMEAPRRGNGADFDANAKYRMYHGELIPGFPQHPHRGFETVTATIEGLVDHTDSLGSAGRYGQGDLQWMTAGSGIVHGEMFPLLDDKAENKLRFFQIWLNLPSKSKMVEPTFTMHWADKIPRMQSVDGLANVTLWAGALGGKTGLPPPPNSWAASAEHDVMILHVDLAPGGEYTVPAASGSINRAAYYVEGDHLEVNGQAIKGHSMMVLGADVPVTFRNPEASKKNSEVLFLQGRPIGEPVAQRGPFVMNSQQEITQAYQDFQRTRFGGWPWPQDAMVFPREKGRFSLFNGKEDTP